MLDRFMVGTLVVDFFFYFVKAALCFLIPSREGFVLFVVVNLVLRNMGVLVNAVLNQPCDDVKLIGQFCFLMFKSGCVKDRFLNNAKGVDDSVLIGERFICG